MTVELIDDTHEVLQAYDHAKQQERAILVERLAKYLRRNDGSSHRPRTAAYYVRAHNILWPKGSEDV